MCRTNDRLNSQVLCELQLTFPLNFVSTNHREAVIVLQGMCIFGGRVLYLLTVMCCRALGTLLDHFQVRTLARNTRAANINVDYDLRTNNSGVRV